MPASPVDYVTIAEVKRHLPDTDFTAIETYDTVLSDIITSASRAIDRHTEREQGAYQSGTVEVRYFDGSGEVEQWLDELAAVPTTVAIDESLTLTYTAALASTDYFLWPYNAAQYGHPYLRLDMNVINGDYSRWPASRRAVKVAAKFGYSMTVPSDIKDACLIQCIRRFKRAQQAFQDTGAISELNQLRYVKSLDPDVKEMIDHLKRIAL